MLEIGCGPGAMARDIARKVGNGYVLGIDRSAKAIALATAGCYRDIEADGGGALFSRRGAAR